MDPDYKKRRLGYLGTKHENAMSLNYVNNGEVVTLIERLLNDTGNDPIDIRLLQALFLLAAHGGRFDLGVALVNQLKDKACMLNVEDHDNGIKGVVNSSP